MAESVTSVSWEQAKATFRALCEEIAGVIVGQNAIIDQMLVALLCNGHCLIVGVPGLAKTLLVSTMGQILGLTFRRIQFTPDLMPSDIIGSDILQQEAGTGNRSLEFSPGPVFANLILADEINRTPPKTQSALLEAMQERQVTVGGRTMPLQEPFLVFATQNPIEHEGTYPLPEAQLDRFFFNLVISYPALDEERDIVLRTTGHRDGQPRQVLSPAEIIALQDMALDVPMPDHVLDTILRIVHSTRPESTLALDDVKQYVAWGAGPRASQNITRAAKALAFLRGQPAASLEEVKEVAMPVLRHRVIPNYNATGEGVTVEQIIEGILAGV